MTFEELDAIRRKDDASRTRQSVIDAFDTAIEEIGRSAQDGWDAVDRLKAELVRSEQRRLLVERDLASKLVEVGILLKERNDARADAQRSTVGAGG